MKYLIIIGFIFLTTNFSQAQMAEGKEYKYTITFNPITFEGQEAKDIVSEFRKHVFSMTNIKFDFQTRYNESGEMYFETTYPVKKSIVDSFFELRNKSYIAFKTEVEAPAVYAFNTSK